jgi:WD40 repeat protein
MFFDVTTGRRAGAPYRALRAISAVRFSPDGTLVALVEGDSVDVLDARTHQPRTRLLPAPPSTSWLINTPWVLGAIAFSPDSRVLAADVIHNQLRRSSADIVRWDVRTGRRLAPARQLAPTPEATLAGFTARGARLVTSSAAGDASVIRDAATLQPQRRLRGGDAHAAISPDGRIVALGGADGSVRMLDVQTGVLRVAAGRHDGAVTDLRFTPDARTLLTAGADGRVIEWNVADAQRIETFTGHAGSVSQLAVAPDGRTAYSAGENGTVIAWDLVGDRRLDRPFTAHHEARSCSPWAIVAATARPTSPPRGRPCPWPVLRWRRDPTAAASPCPMMPAMSTCSTAGR